jgi:hypothetical protein
MFSSRLVLGESSMRLHSRLALFTLLSSMLAACGGDDAPPPPDVDAAADAATDSGLDAATDGGPDAGPACEAIDVDGDGESACTDCDDHDANRYHGNTEVCDAAGHDEDCDLTTYGPDGDGDGFVSIACCNTQTGGALACGTDCDDAHATVSPSAVESCNGVDDDCDGTTDEAVCVDECVLGTPCAAGLGTCTDTFTGYTCACIDGYTAPAVGGPCVDVDECTLGTDDCDTDPPAGCTNTAGSFTCACPAGYTGDGHGVSGCVDIDECAAGTPCGAGLGSCANLPGTYVCACTATGYDAPATGGTCADIDECARGTDDCDASATCANTAGDFKCPCPAGVGGSGHGPASCSGPRFTDLGGGLVRDNNGSGLVWQQAVDARSFTQADAIVYCAGLGGGWRLPTKDELLSIVDTTRTNPCIDPTYFPGTPVSAFWSASSVADPPSSGWYVFFNNGSTNVDFATDALRARCVR